MPALASPFALIALLAIMVPGVVYEAVRATSRGPSPASREATSRVLSALLISTFFDVVYLIALGSWIPERLATVEHAPEQIAWTRWDSLTLAFLLFVIPAFTALVVPDQADRVLQKIPGVSRLLHRWRVDRFRRYNPVPSAWDYQFNRLQQRGSEGLGEFVVVTLTTGGRVGGLFGRESFATAYPNEHEIFVEKAWSLDAEGALGEELDRGFWAPGSQIAMIEFVPPQQEASL